MLTNIIIWKSIFYVFTFSYLNYKLKKNQRRCTGTALKLCLLNLCIRFSLQSSSEKCYTRLWWECSFKRRDPLPAGRHSGQPAWRVSPPWSGTPRPYKKKFELPCLSAQSWSWRGESRTTISWENLLNDNRTLHFLPKF